MKGCKERSFVRRLNVTINQRVVDDIDRAGGRLK